MTSNYFIYSNFVTAVFKIVYIHEKKSILYVIPLYRVKNGTSSINKITLYTVCLKTFFFHRIFIRFQNIGVPVFFSNYFRMKLFVRKLFVPGVRRLGFVARRNTDERFEADSSKVSRNTVQLKHAEEFREIRSIRSTNRIVLPATGDVPARRAVIAGAPDDGCLFGLNSQAIYSYTLILFLYCLYRHGSRRDGSWIDLNRSNHLYQTSLSESLRRRPCFSRGRVEGRSKSDGHSSEPEPSLFFEYTIYAI